MKNKYIKTILLILTLILSLEVTACSTKNKQVTTNLSNKDIEQDKKLTDSLKNEKEIKEGQVYIQNNMVVATMIIKDEVKKEDSEKLVERYAKNLKKQYNDKLINIQAIQDGKNIANITVGN